MAQLVLENLVKSYGPTRVLSSSNTTPKLLSALPAGDDYLLKYGVLQKFHNIEGLS